jgi:hypothetical protein
MVVAFLDLLGVRARWHRGGRKDAEAAFDRFRQLVAFAIRETNPRTVKTGVIETDAAAIVFESTEEAIRYVQVLYLHTFKSATRPSHSRVWLRGTVTSINDPKGLRTRSTLAVNRNVSVFTLDSGLLEAIAVEKSGFKGMRLLIQQSLVTEAIRKAFGITVGDKTFYPFRRLTNSAYPGRIAAGFDDFLWMAHEKEADWRPVKRLMAARLRWCAQDPEEFLHAAATQVVFNESVAIFRSLQAS